MAWIYWVLAFLSHIVSRKAAIYFSEKLGNFMYFSFYRLRIQAVISNLKMVYKGIGRVAVRRLVLEIFGNFARVIYEFLILPTFNKENLYNYLDINHKEYLDDAVKTGKGVFVLTAHLGNWELGAGMLAILGYSPTILALANPSKYVKNFFTRRRQAVGINVIYLGESLKKVISVLRRGGVIATVGDRSYSGPTVQIPFFGKPAHFPQGAFQLAKHTNSIILPAFCVRENGKYCVHFEPPIKEGLKEWIRILERYVKRYITQWFIFDKLWD